LHESPFAVFRKSAFAKWKFVQRNSGPLNGDLPFVAAKIDNRALQRFRANQNQRHRSKHLPRRFSIGRFLHVHQNICAVKRNDGRLWPFPDEREQMHGDMAEINVEQSGLGLAQDPPQSFQFPTGNLPWLIAHFAKPEPAKLVHRPFRHDPERLEGKARCVFTFLRN
jgi:hypothetical protein